METYIRPKKLAEVLGVDVSTLYRWARNGKFPKPIKVYGKITVWKVTEVADFQKAVEGANAV